VETRGLIVQGRFCAFGEDVGPNWSKFRLVTLQKAFQRLGSPLPSTDAQDNLFLFRN
jgi:hypothetical protein